MDEAYVRERCTEAVFERGITYHEEGRIRRLSRFGRTVTARVRGSRVYEVRLDLSTYDPRCTCPYDGPGDCKHAVAVLLELTDGLPPDGTERIDSILEDARTEELRDFLRDEFVHDPRMRERFFAHFGETVETSAGGYRDEIDRLFGEHADESGIVVEAIDFTPLTDLATRYRQHGNYRRAATIYRELARGIEENVRRVDAAYDHYQQTFREALDAYVRCLSTADLGLDERRAHVEFLSERAHTAPDYLREHYRDALDTVHDGEVGHHG